MVFLLLLALAVGNAFLFYPEQTGYVCEQFISVVKIIAAPMDYERPAPSGSHSEEEETQLVIDEYVPQSMVVALDPGHGGKDPGSVSVDGKMRENEINLRLAEMIEKILEENGVSVVMTSRDQYVTLEERVEIARQAGARLFVSLHHNANYADHSGCEIYVGAPGNECTDEALRLARLMMDNLTDTGINKRGIFFRLSQAGTLDEEGYPADYYAVIRMCRQIGIPAMLTETAFLNKTDRPFVEDKQEEVAKAYAGAILEYLDMEIPGEPQASEMPGDANLDGRVDKKDLNAALSAVLCKKSPPVGEGYRAVDINADGLIDAFDIFAIRAVMEGGAVPELSLSDERAVCSITPDQDVFKKGKTLSVEVKIGEGADIASVVGTVDYNTDAFDYIGAKDQPGGLTVEEDEKFGVVRFQFLAEEADGELSFIMRFKMTGNQSAPELSMNLNCYSAVSIEDEKPVCLLPSCAQTIISVSR